MLLTITTTHQPATDLGFLLSKHPERVQTFDLAFGQAHVFYPHATRERCTAALLLDIDPIGLVRGRTNPPGDGFALRQYVNDRPYVASSFLSVALAQVYGSALNAKSREHLDLVHTPLPLIATLTALPCRGGEALLRRLWEPLGYRVAVTPHSLDTEFLEWGQSQYVDIELQTTAPLHVLLAHLYVLVPVLDDEKHYWFGPDEVDKLLRRGEGWLPAHPERTLIVERYLRRRRSLTRAALARLVNEEEEEEEEEEAPAADAQMPEQVATVEEKRSSLHQQRLDAVQTVLRDVGARRVLDLGCGEGKLLQLLLRDPLFEQIVGVDVAYRKLEIARDRLMLERLPPQQGKRITLLHGSLIYRDARLAGFDAAAVVEVVEHLDPARLSAFERVLFEFARPTTVVVTTPNREYNSMWETLAPEQLRHGDHRFEWTRAEFETWANGVAERNNYAVRFVPIGPSDPTVGAPTQMAVFGRGG